MTTSESSKLMMPQLTITREQGVPLNKSSRECLDHALDFLSLGPVPKSEAIAYLRSCDFPLYVGRKFVTIHKQTGKGNSSPKLATITGNFGDWI